MKILLASIAAALALGQLAPPASAETSMYLLGGPAVVSLGGDAEDMGNDMAAVLTDTVGGDWTADQGSRLGYQFGFGYSYTPDTKPLGFAVELHFARRGTSWEMSDRAGGSEDVEVKLNAMYVEIPLLLQYTPGAGARLRPRVVVGPLLGIRASTKLVVDDVSVGFDDAMRGTYAGAVVGGGLRYRAGEASSLLLEARVLAGLTNVFKSDFGYESKPLDFSVVVGYSLSI